MPRYVALLRALNVGKRRVTMQRLRALFEALTYTDVATFINSGNVLFTTDGRDADALESRIEAQLLDALGWPVETFLRTSAELAAILGRAPFTPEERARDDYARHVVFLKRPLDDDATGAVLALRNAFDDFQVAGREAHWLCRGKVSDSRITTTRWQKALGMPSTARNLATVRALAERLG